MKPPAHRLRQNWSRLASSLLGLLGFQALFLALTGHAAGPSGDLTLTVQEQVDGSVRFTMSGSTTSIPGGYFYDSGYDVASMAPPHTFSGTNVLLPTGLILTAGGVANDFPWLYFTSGGYWFLANFAPNTIPANTPISGSGSIVTDQVDLSYFVPGVYVVNGALFDITYRVLAYSPPSLRVTKSLSFPTTRVGRSSSPRKIRIANIGGDSAKNLRVTVLGAKRRDYLARRPRSTSLAPGAATTCAIVFRPRASGIRRAQGVVRSSNALPRTFSLSGKGR